MGTRIYGPYEDKRQGGWRAILKEGENQISRRFRTFEEAQEYVTQVKEGLGEDTGKTVQEVIDEYEQAKKDQGKKAVTVATTLYRLKGFLGELMGVQVSKLSHLRCERAYMELAKRTGSPNTHRNSLSEARTWGKWLVKRGYVKVNPFTRIEPLGAPNAGKLTLTRDESRAFVCVALQELQEGKDSGLGVLLALLMGLRASEIIGLVGRDVDDGGQALLVQRGKTKNAKRGLQVPEMLIMPLITRAAEAGTHGRILPYRREWVLDNTARVCRAAHVPVVTAHGLRGTHASLAMGLGVSPMAVAASLGHGSTGVTLKHYATPESVLEGSMGKVIQLVRP